MRKHTAGDKGQLQFSRYSSSQRGLFCLFFKCFYGKIMMCFILRAAVRLFARLTSRFLLNKELN